MTVQCILDALRSFAIVAREERAVQDAIERIFKATSISHVREFQLSHAERPDFMVGRIVVEVKVNGGPSAVASQLARYATHDAVDAIVLATTRMQHLRGIPETINGKPVHIVKVGQL